MVVWTILESYANPNCVSWVHIIICLQFSQPPLCLNEVKHGKSPLLKAPHPKYIFFGSIMLYQAKTQEGGVMVQRILVYLSSILPTVLVFSWGYVNIEKVLCCLNGKLPTINIFSFKVLYSTMLYMFFYVIAYSGITYTIFNERENTQLSLTMSDNLHSLQNCWQFNIFTHITIVFSPRVTDYTTCDNQQ